MSFVKLKRRVYRHGGYITTDMLIAVDNIARVVECTDDFSCTNIITKDGEVITLLQRYDDVVKQIMQTNQHPQNREGEA